MPSPKEPGVAIEVSSVANAPEREDPKVTSGPDSMVLAKPPKRAGSLPATRPLFFTGPGEEAEQEEPAIQFEASV